jgi:hypothetical protein
MTLPASRNETYTAGSPVKSNTLNALQDAIVGAQHGEIVLQIPAAAGEVDFGGVGVNNTWKYSAATGGGTAAAWVQPGADDQNLHYPIVLPEGARIKEIRAHIRDTSGSNTITMKLLKIDGAADTTTQIGATQTSAGSGAVQTLALTGLTEVLTSGSFYVIVVQNTTATVTTHRSFGCRVTADKPS